MDAMTGSALIDHKAYRDAILETLSDAVVVLDRKLQALEINRAGLEMLGAGSLEELQGLNFSTLLRFEDLPVIRKHYAAMISGRGEPALPATVIISSLDGKTRVLEGCMARLVRSEGEREGVLIRARDITVSMDSHRAADDYAALLRAILATVPDAMVVIDAQGRITSFSAVSEDMFGYREAKVLGKNVSMLLPPPYLEAHDGYLSHYVETGERRMIGVGRVVEGSRRDGSVFPMELSVGEARSGDHRAFTGFIQDLTGRMTTEARLHQIQSELAHASRLSAVGTLASALAHEINQPLAAIVNYLSAGQEFVGEDRPCAREIVRDALEEAAKEALRAGKIVHRLCDFVSKGEIISEIISRLNA